jgi:hypothetical protein
MRNKDNGGSAFPSADAVLLKEYHLESIGRDKFQWMKLRDYFAAKAMQGIISAVPHLSEIDPRDAAEEAYSYADAMLAERAK